MEELYQEQVDLYIRGKMTPQEENEFILECKRNPELKQVAIATAYMVKGLMKLHGK